METPRAPIYPLELSLSRVQTAWGGFPGRVGEICSLSGPPRESVVLNGELAGRRLTELAGRHLEEILGRGMELDAREPFPMRLRFLSTVRDLPVKAYPNDGYTLYNQLPAVGQEKVFYVVAARGKGRLFCGWKEPWSRGKLAKAVPEDGVRDLLHPLPVRPGQVYTLPPGRPWALGAGLTLFEIARHSTAGFLLSRAGYRDLPDNLSEILEPDATRPAPIHGISVPSGRSRIDYLCYTPRFSLRRFSVSGALDLSLPGDRFRVYTGLRGSGWLKWGFSFATCAIQPHQSILVPAFPEDVTLESENGMDVLEASLTNLPRGGLREVAGHGFSETEVASLGGTDYGHVLLDYLHD